MKKVIVISPHPDDESIGVGGTISKHVDEGDMVHIIFLTSGEKGGHGLNEDDTKKLREEEAKEATTILKTSSIDFWREPDGKFEASDVNVTRLVSKIIECAADVIYVPHKNEEHPDHKAAAQLVKEALLRTDGSVKKPIVYMYEVWTPIQQIDHIEDISPYVETKRIAIQAHKSQCLVLRFDEAILGLNRYRGEMHSWPGGDYAEIFLIMN
jgi:N-acetylglucosamine malate deacetylase 1